jgi:predicted DNA-binding transcriptional regulator AlpA
MRKRLEEPPNVGGMALISQAKAAEMCGMTRAAIHDLVRRRRFRSVEVEGRDLVYLEEVETFAAEREKRQNPA